MDGAAGKVEIVNDRDPAPEGFAELKTRLGQSTRHGGQRGQRHQGLSIRSLTDGGLRKTWAAPATGPPLQVDEKRVDHLPFGADRVGPETCWEKGDSGLRTSILVGFAAAIVITILGTFLGALAGLFRRQGDDGLNWFGIRFSA